MRSLQIPHGIADDLIADLTAKARSTGVDDQQSFTTVRPGRWIERKVEDAGIHAIVGAVADVAFRSASVRGARPGSGRPDRSQRLRTRQVMRAHYEAGLGLSRTHLYGSLNSSSKATTSRERLIKDVQAA